MKKRATVLFVDDEKINLLLFEKRFEKDFDVFVATSGPEALDLLKEHAQSINVVISDMRMAEMDGLEFIRSARQLFTDINYFILSGYNHHTELDQALQDGVISGLLKKPYDYDAIKKAAYSNSESLALR